MTENSTDSNPGWPQIMFRCIAFGNINFASLIFVIFVYKGFHAE